MLNVSFHRKEIMQIFTKVYGADSASWWYYRWQIYKHDGRSIESIILSDAAKEKAVK